MLGQAPALATLVILLVVRWLLGPISYAVGAPGGIFAPPLLIGAAAGSLFAGVVASLSGIPRDSTAFAMIGMATLFAGVVRAPFTGILLVVEMTASAILMVPLLLDSVAAVLAETPVGSEPIYDTLRTRMPSTGQRA